MTIIAEIERLEHLRDAVARLDLKPRRDAMFIRHLEGCRSIRDYGQGCDCGMPQVVYALRGPNEAGPVLADAMAGIEPDNERTRRE